jgi:hypothetical protein
MSIMVFLGSGISRPTWRAALGESMERIPDVKGITHAMLTGNWKKTNNFFEPRGPNERPCPEARRCQQFLRRLCCRVGKYYRDGQGSAPNYEDLFYLTDQLCSTELNPATQHFIEEIQVATRDLRQRESGLNRESSFDEMCPQVCDFIQCVVWKQLDRQATPRGMDLILDLARHASGDSDIQRLTICTLNHDVLVERLFNSKDIKYEDGFTEMSYGGRLFDPKRLRKSSERIQLLKLHGSINWFRWQKRIDKDEHYVDHYVIGRGYKPPKKKDVRWIEDEFPRILAGSYNKHAEYNRGIFKEFMHAFHLQLSEHKLIVMSGYGWSDFGINERLCDWLGRERSHRIVMLSKDDPIPMLRQNHVIWLQWERLISLRKLVVMRKWIEDVPAWAEITEHIAQVDRPALCSDIVTS